MTDILIVPEQVLAYRDHLVEQVGRATETYGQRVSGFQFVPVGATYLDGSTPFPVDAVHAMVDWLPAEQANLQQMTMNAVLAVLTPCVEAKARAEALQLDQSLALAVGSPTGSGFGTTGDGAGGLYATMAFAPYVDTNGDGLLDTVMRPVPAPAPVFQEFAVVGGMTHETFLANNPLLGVYEKFQHTNPEGANQALKLHLDLQASQNRMIDTWLS